MEEGLTELLQRWSAGDPDAHAKVLPLVYDELHRLARNVFRHEHQKVTLQPTALLHEAYIRLAGGMPPQWEGRQNLLCIFASVMRRVLVDHARRRQREKRRGLKVTLDTRNTGLQVTPGRSVLDVHQALVDLEQIDAAKARIIELRYFGGMTIEEAASALGVSVSTVRRHQTFAEAWMARAMRSGA